MGALPYAGLNVLDMSQGIAGPYVGVLLGQQGASVIKVEPPAGDWIRLTGGGKDGMTALSIANNLGKRSISLDAARPDGRALVLELAQRADVFLENFRPGVMKKLGLDYAELAAVNPRLIYVSISGFGDSGPEAHMPATDSVVQAKTGMAVANKDALGRPRRIGILVPDTVTALYATQCVAAALYARDKAGATATGGKHIKLSLAGCCAAFQAAPILDEFLFAGQFKPPITVPAGVFATRDGHLVLATLRDAMWTGLCNAVNREEWLSEPLYATSDLRKLHGVAINALVAKVLLERTTADWAQLFEKHDVLCSPVQTYAQLRADPQIRHMGYFGTAHQAPFGEVPMPHFPGTAHSGPLPSAPLVGEHSREILAELGWTDAEIGSMQRSGLVHQAA